MNAVVTLVGLGIAMAGHEAVKFAVGHFGEYVPVALPDDPTGHLGSDLTKWVVAIALAGYVLLVEGKSLASVGIRPMDPLAFVGWVVGGILLTFVLGGIAMAVPDRFLQAPEDAVGEMQEGSVPARLRIAVTAGVTESLAYQGYPIERLAALTGSVPVAGALSFVAFTAVHYTGDAYSLRETLYIGVPAFCVTVLYVLSGNLLVVIVVHSAVDAISLLLTDSSDEAEQTADPDPA